MAYALKGFAQEVEDNSINLLYVLSAAQFPTSVTYAACLLCPGVSEGHGFRLLATLCVALALVRASGLAAESCLRLPDCPGLAV